MKKQIKKVTINNEALASVLNVKKGAVIDVECKNGVPVVREWRNRFKDSKIDGCISIGDNKKTTKGAE